MTEDRDIFREWLILMVSMGQISPNDARRMLNEHELDAAIAEIEAGNVTEFRP